VVASSACEKNAPDDSVDLGFEVQEVGNQAYLNRHNTEMFKSGRSFSGNERNKVWVNRGDGTFADLSDLSGADSVNDGRAVIATDFDDDGDVDLFLHSLQRERHILYRNDLGTAGGFLKLRLRAETTQWEAIGATVLVEAGELRSAQVLSRGAGFVSCQAPELVFGLGGAEAARVSVRWPSGALEDFGSLESGSRALLVEGSGNAEPIAARPRPFPEPLPLGFRLRVGDSFPTLALLDPEGNPTSFDPQAAADGETLFVNLWASYCTSCIKEMPDLTALHGEEGKRVVAISMDTVDLREMAHRLFSKRAGEFPAFYLPEEGPEGARMEDVVDLERLPIPSTVVLDGEGVIRRIITGPIETD